MFHVEKRDEKTTRWFPIWSSEDGADCADYLKQNCQIDKGEYRMVYRDEKPVRSFIGMTGAEEGTR